MKNIILAILLIFSVVVANSATYTVTTTGDSGTNTLRYALQMCMSSAGPHTINFNIPTTDANYNPSTGVWVIMPASDLPMIIQSNVTIDGTTQTSFAGDTNPYGPEIVIDGSNARDYGFRFMNAPNATLKGLNIRRFSKGAQFYGSANSIVSGCYVGTNETGDSIMGNDIGLEFISNSDYCTIGGTTTADRNIISGNLHIGIRLLDVKYCAVKGNYIGTNREGTGSLPNYDGMSMEGAVQFCTIGGTTPAGRNIISGNTDYGLPLFGAGATQNVIIGNYIGTDVTGTLPLGNTYGVLFDDGSFSNRVGGDTDSERNIISGNVGYGVFFYNNGTNNNLLKNNFIGTDYTGRYAVANTAGIIIDGISYKNIMDGNIISGNEQVGIGINITASDSNVIVRNYIGTDVDGNPLPNGLDGIRISQGVQKTIIGGSPEEANIIANNGGCGVYITNDNSKYNLISCNSFYNNGGLAIDLFEPGVNLNDDLDEDEGANNKLNFPTIDEITFTDTAIRINGNLDVLRPQTYKVEIYKASPDHSGFGEGMQYICTVNPCVRGAWSAYITGFNENDFFTTLAIDPENNTSEFSPTYGIGGFVSKEDFNVNDFSIYPNPTDGKIKIDLLSGQSSKVEIFDINGRRLQIMDVTGNSTIDLSNYKAGTYIVRANGRNKAVVKE
ncbi:MAG: T9SS type A sorting domain-containing protein [Bacteroidales bacterium]|nr:T9SS type A sorting domain-containing protein [Bacteroidales bacterium]